MTSEQISEIRSFKSFWISSFVGGKDLAGNNKHSLGSEQWEYSV